MANATADFDSDDADYEQEMLKHATPEHEAMHSTMAIILMFCLLASQYAILFWKRGHPKSFNLFSTIGLCVIPPAMAYVSRSWRFLTIWALFSLANLFMVIRARQKPLQSITPRMVYKFYSNAYRGTYAMGVVGYIGMFITMFMQFPQWVFETALILFLYGTYFGVLSRDIVDRLSESMAQSMGFYTKEGIPTKHLRSGQCAVCGSAPEDYPADKIHRLTCGHIFHEKCIRGWVMCGKKLDCPYCKEKVDLSQFKTNVWDAQQMLYLNMLDFVRYMVVWQPLIFTVVNLVYKVFGLD